MVEFNENKAIYNNEAFTGLVNPEKILKEGRSDEGEYWYSKGYLKKYARYELGVELDYKEWDESGNVKE